MRKTLLLTPIPLLIVVTALSQINSTPPPKLGEIQVAESRELVTLNVIVTDRNGHYVEGLTPDQFEIYDNNVKQDITRFSFDDSSATFGIVYEVDENDTEQLSGVLNALKQFVSTLQDDDDFFFVVFNKRGSATTGFIPSPAQILEYMQFVSVGDPFSLYDSIYFATERLKQSPNIKKALFVISDAKDDGSSNSYRKLRYRVRNLNAQIYVIGRDEPAADTLRGWHFEDLTRQSGKRSFLQDTDTGVGRLVLDEMSRASRDSYFPQAESESELAGICTQIKLELHRQYTFGFYSNVTGGKWHTLKVRLRETTQRGYTLSYREGYFEQTPS
ncbi:MAG TPA: VWA domain-containing protein [Pyrinomonadaceae bacterium]|nr:VWA domain-containing protein [Pyrinomonadaceae bacterium]